MIGTTHRARRLAATLTCLVLLGSCSARTPEVVDAGAHPTRIDFDYVIPAGTGDRSDRGERVEILPAVLVAHVGQIIRIVNDDSRGHVVGPFYVNAGATMTQRFASPGRFVGECTVHPSGSIELDVTA